MDWRSKAHGTIPSLLLDLIPAAVEDGALLSFHVQIFGFFDVFVLRCHAEGRNKDCIIIAIFN